MGSSSTLTIRVERKVVLGRVPVNLVVDVEIAVDAIDLAPCVSIGLGDLAEGMVGRGALLLRK